jgi:Tfp pilus assembly protein PilN
MANRHYHNGWNIIINLASHPRRNLRFFRLLISGLTVLLVAILSYLVIFNLRSFSEYRKASVSNQELASKIAALTSENRNLARELQNLSHQLKPAVDEINGLLEQRAFSWVMFFSRLEEALPSGSYLVSLNPSRSSSAMEFRFKVGLSNGDDLSPLLKNLQQQGFGEIKVLNESFQDGKFQVEMSFKDVEVK